MTTNYVPNTNGKARKVMSLDEINHWFRVWGILGKRRKPILKLVLYFDKGPGVCH